MIRIPFDRCVILTTLNLEQIASRLEGAIYDPSFLVGRDVDSPPQRQSFYGKIHSFKFSATRMLGHKYAHLPMFLSPTIEGDILALANGYQISLAVKLQNITVALLLTWLGGLLATLSVVFDKVFTNIQDDKYFAGARIFLLLYPMAIGYLYWASWQSTKFFRLLFAQGLTGFHNYRPAERQQWTPDLPQVPVPQSATDWMSKNLPSFPLSKATIDGGAFDRQTGVDQ